MATLVTMTVDTEEEWDWDSGWPTGAPEVSNIDDLVKFQSLCEEAGILPTYFTNHAVLANPRSRRIIQDIAGARRAEIGMHIHPWNTPPLASNGQVRARETFLHNLPPDLIQAKLDSVWREFENAGLAPTSFRGGRYSCNQLIQNWLRDRGVVADASVVPFTTWKDDGAPDYRHRGLEPARLPPRREGDAALWEIPLTLAFSRRPYRFWSWCFEKIENSALGKLRLIGIAERLGVVRKMWLNFEYESPEVMLSFLRKLAPLALPCISLTIHSSSMVPGKSPFVTSPAEQERMFAGMRRVFAAITACPDFVPVTMTKAAQHLEEQYLARSRH